MPHRDEPADLPATTARFLDTLVSVMEASGRASGVRPRIFMKDASGRYLKVNAAFAEDAAMLPEQIVGLSDLDLYPQDLAVRYRTDDARVLAERRCLTVEEPYAQAEQLRMVKTTKAPVYADDGTPIGIVGLLVDVTDERWREEQAQIHAHLLEVGQRLAHLGTWSFRPSDGRFECSEGLMDILGLPEPRVVKTMDQFLGFFELDARESIEAIIAGTVPDVALDGAEFRMRGADGAFRTVVMRLHVSKGALSTHIVGTVQDVTSKRNRERELLRLNKVLRALSDSHSALTRSATEDDLIQGVCDALTGQELFPLAWIGEPQDDADRRILLRAAAGTALSYLDGIEVSWSDQVSGQGPTGRAVKSGRAVIIDDVATSQAFAPWARRAQNHGLRCAAAVPIFADRHVIAVLTVYSMTPGAFGPQEVDLLQGFADDLGYGIATLRARAELEDLHDIQAQQEDRLRSAMIHTIEALASTLESRDPYTAGHQSRVAEIACRIGETLGLDADRLEGLRLAAMVHDIGKIKVPIQILAKPTRLTEIEFELIKTHSAAGHEILKTLDLPWPVADMVVQHHEYLDGSGYPCGLRGDEILLESRILTVADIVESMSSARPYRPPLGMDAALEEINRLRGTRLDPDVVDACLKVFGTCPADL